MPAGNQVQRRERLLAAFIRLAEAAAAARQHHTADGGDQQQEGRELECQQEARQQQLADVGGRAEMMKDRAQAGRRSRWTASRPVPSSAINSSTSSAPVDDRAAQAQAGADRALGADAAQTLADRSRPRPPTYATTNTYSTITAPA